MCLVVGVFFFFGFIGILWSSTKNTLCAISLFESGHAALYRRPVRFRFQLQHPIAEVRDDKKTVRAKHSCAPTQELVLHKLE